MLNIMLYLSSLVWSGVNLSDLKELFVSACRLMEKYSRSAHLSQTIQMDHNISRLIDVNGDTSYRIATNMQVGHDLKRLNPHAVMVHSFQKMHISFMFREYDEAK